MAHQAVEVVGRGDAGVGLEVHDLGLLLDDGGQLAGDARRFFERRAFGHVDDDLELALVVERQHLHLDEADADESDRAEQQHRDQRQKAAARSGVVEQRIHDAAVEAREAVLAFAGGAWPAALPRIRTAAHGVTTKATISENTIAADAPMGMGRM